MVFGFKMLTNLQFPSFWRHAETCHRKNRRAQTYNRRQYKWRHFTLNWAFLRFTDFTRRKYNYSCPIPPCSAVPMFELPVENNKHPQLEWTGRGGGGGGGGCGFSCSLKLPYLSTISTILSPIVASVQTPPSPQEGDVCTQAKLNCEWLLRANLIPHKC